MSRRKKLACKTRIYSTIVSRRNAGNPIRGKDFAACAKEIAIHQVLHPSCVDLVRQLLIEMDEEGWFEYEDYALVPLPVGADSKPLGTGDITQPTRSVRSPKITKRNPVYS